MILKRLLLLSALIVLTQLVGKAQTPEKGAAASPAETAQKAKPELEKKAAALLDEVVTDAGALRLIENRLFVLTTAANLLWARDEARARTWLREAMNQFYAIEPPAQSAPVGPEQMQQWEMRSMLRMQLLQFLAERDPKLALEFLRASRQTPPDSLVKMTGRQSNDFEQQFELQLAAKMAENDPAEALRIAEETLNKELNHQVLEILSLLQKKDAAAARRLSGQIITKLKSADLVKGYTSSSIAFSMFFDIRARIQAAQRDPKQAAIKTVAPLADLEQTLRDLLEIMATAVQKVTASTLLDMQEQGQARQLLSQAQMMMPELEKYLPRQAAAVRVKLNQFDKAFYRAPIPTEPIEAMEKKTADELLAMAGKAQPEIKDMLYRQAAIKAAEQGDGERARQIVKQFIPAGTDDPIMREIEGKEREHAAEQGKFEEARQSLAQLSSDHERALALINLARQAGTKNQAKTQRQLLEEARALIGERLETRAQVTVQLALAGGYLPLDPDRSFTTLETSIEKLNTVMAAIILLDNFDAVEGGLFGGSRFKDGEMRMTNAEFASGFTDNFGELLNEFAQADFDRTKNALRRWQVNEVRLMMDLLIAENILKEKKESSPNIGRGYPRPRIY